ncbi:MAG: hypothetical protein KDA89_07510 [Planctomycetaceae bacterium]|nr:hypothetical protein [Planctomycetaceae bacterium]
MQGRSAWNRSAEQAPDFPAGKHRDFSPNLQPKAGFDPLVDALSPANHRRFAVLSALLQHQQQITQRTL